jgi:hypothetical protein
MAGTGLEPRMKIRNRAMINSGNARMPSMMRRTMGMMTGGFTPRLLEPEKRQNHGGQTADQGCRAGDVEGFDQGREEFDHQ